jgi:15-cis-phytoene synthase
MTVDESYTWCNQVARTQAKNFYYSFLLLSPPQRRAMCAIYAFMRYCDDLSDSDEVAMTASEEVAMSATQEVMARANEDSKDKASAIERWRADLETTLAGGAAPHPLWPAFADAVARYRIPHQYFFDMIEGVRSDLEPRRIQTFEELYDYCYHVASVVGLTIIHIFGFDSPEALKLAEKCGIAFQLTNILRDVREDALHDRIYLPAEDLARMGVSAADLTKPQPSENFLRLMEFEARRARDYYRQSAPLIEWIDPRSRASLRALIEIYSRLLDRIVTSNYDVLARRIRVPTWEKLWVLASARLF